MPFYVGGRMGSTVQTAELDNDAVTVAKIKQGTSAQVLMSNATPDTAWTTIGGDATIGATGSLSVSDLTISSEAQGDVLYNNGSNWVRLAAGTSGQFLKTNGAAANPAWADGGGKEIKVNTATWTTNFTTTSTSFVDVTSGTVTVSGLDSGKTYDLIAVANVPKLDNTNNTGLCSMQMVVDSTNDSVIHAYNTNAGQGLFGACHGSKLGVTGSTSYSAKIQIKSNSGSYTSSTNSTTETCRITLVAIEQ